MNVGYFSVNEGINDARINWEILKSRPPVEKGKYFTRISFEKPLTVMMDGRKGIAVISINN
jgi:hypothetical protein